MMKKEKRTIYKIFDELIIKYLIIRMKRLQIQQIVLESIQFINIINIIILLFIYNIKLE